MRGGMPNAFQKASQNRCGREKNIPTIPAQKPAQVNSETAQPQRRQRKDPTNHRAGSPADNLLHQEERHQTQKAAGPGNGDKQNQIKPEGCIRSVLQVNDVGYQVRRIGKERQPDDRADEYQEPTKAPVTPGNVIGNERETQRQPGKEDVPPEPGVRGMIGMRHSQNEQADAKHG